MMNRFLILGFALCLTATAAGAEPKEPEYDGKPLSYWRKALTDPDGKLKSQAVVALGKIGPAAKDAIPDLLPLIHDKQPNVDACFAVLGIGAPEADERLAVRTLLVRVQIRRCTPSVALLLVHPDFVPQHAARLTPHLIALLKDELTEVRARSAESLALLGPTAADAAAALKTALEDKEVRVRQEAGIALAKVDPKQTEAMVAFLAGLPAGQPTDYRHTLSWSLYRIGTPAVPYLIPLIGDAKAPGSGEALTAIRYIGEPVVPVLVAALSAEDTTRRLGAVRGLGVFSRPGTPAAASLHKALSDSERAVRLLAAEVLTQTDREQVARAVVPVALEVLEYGQPGEQKRAATTLTALGPKAIVAAPALLRLLKAEQAEVRAQAALALEAVDRNQAAAGIPALVEALQQAERATAAAAALGRLGTASQPAIPALREALKAADVHVRASAAQSLVAIDPAETDTAVAVLLEMLKVRQRRHLALQTLTQIGPAAKAAAPALEAMLQTAKGEIDEQVAETLVAVDRARVKKVLALLASRPSDIDDEDIWLLGRIGRTAPEEVVPVLMGILKSPVKNNNGQRQQTAATALGGLKAAAKAAVPVLVEVAKDKTHPANRMAGMALKRIDRQAAAQAGVQ